MDWTFLLNCFITVLAILDPVGTVAIFLSLLADATHDERRRAARYTALTVLATLTLATVAGRQVLELFGISLAAFRVAGGAVILGTGFAMLRGDLGRRGNEAKGGGEAAARPEVLAIVPLGVPTIAGAGSISTVILFEHRAAGWGQTAGLFGTIVLCTVILYLALHYADVVQSVLGRTGMGIVTRLMGLVLAAMGVQFLANGAIALFPAWSPATPGGP